MGMVVLQRRQPPPMTQPTDFQQQLTSFTYQQTNKHTIIDFMATDDYLISPEQPIQARQFCHCSHHELWWTIETMPRGLRYLCPHDGRGDGYKRKFKNPTMQGCCLDTTSGSQQQFQNTISVTEKFKRQANHSSRFKRHANHSSRSLNLSRAIRRRESSTANYCGIGISLGL